MKRYEKVEFAILVTSILVAAIVSILDLIGALDSISWLSDHLPAITLLLLSLVAQSVLLFSYKSSSKLDNIEERISKQGMLLKTFDTDTEMIEYIIKRIKSATCVYDLTWLPPFISREISQTRNKAYLKAIEESSKHITYREIMIFYTKDRLEKAKYLVKHTGPGYELGYYEQQPENSPMLMQFIIFDEEEIIFSRQAIKGKEYLAPLVGYYKNLWKNAKKIRVGKLLDEKALELLTEKLK